MQVTIIGIAGASGSGKTTIAKELCAHYGEENCTIISADNYYKGLSLEGIPPEEQRDVNWDHPDRIDFQLLAEHLSKLKSNETIQIPLYDFKTSSRMEETKEVKPKKFIIVEGILVLHPNCLAKLFNTKIFVKTDSDLCFIRRLERDTEERGFTPAEVVKQYKKSVKPMYKEYVKPSKKRADLIVENNKDFTEHLHFDMTPITQAVEQAGTHKKQKRYELFSKSLAQEAGQESSLSTSSSSSLFVTFCKN
ncbi:uridine kinase [Legionella dresdenensis]|uniref:uridine/cytidine kinase n=1 Tax=Legionella dresdenensis TaxID=450200 RepID=A0ABV8CEC2_9GAMM